MIAFEYELKRPLVLSDYYDLSEIINSRSSAFFPLWKSGTVNLRSVVPDSGTIASMEIVVVPMLSPSKELSLTI